MPVYGNLEQEAFILSGALVSNGDGAHLAKTSMGTLMVFTGERLTVLRIRYSISVHETWLSCIRRFACTEL